MYIAFCAMFRTYIRMYVSVLTTLFVANSLIVITWWVTTAGWLVTTTGWVVTTAHWWVRTANWLVELLTGK